jgi:hypothetical protein
MVFVLITLSASLILNIAVLALLKIGLRGGDSGSWADRQPC